MKICSWNVNGLRSVHKTTFLQWLAESKPDIACLQEIKCNVEDLPEELTKIDGYHAYFNSSSRKKGYAGVAIYTKIKPLKVETIINNERFDSEGRMLKLTFEDFTLFNFYLPNGGREKNDMEYKLRV